MPKLIAISLLLAFSYAYTSSFYTAAAVQYTDLGSINNTPSQNLAANFAGFMSDSLKALQANVDVLVFPEAVLWSLAFASQNPRDNMLNYGEAVPSSLPSVSSLCDDSSSLPIVRNLSCIAKAAKLVLIANTIDVQPCSAIVDPHCPADGRYQFNTDLAFDRDGTLLAKYHKSHIFGTAPILDQPFQSDPVWFQAQQNVNGERDLPPIGLLVCYDIQFSQPLNTLLALNIRHFAFSSSWMNTPPIMTAQMFQQAWSRIFNVTLIAANNAFSGMTSGGGIFSSGVPLDSWFDPDALFTNKILIANVPTLHLVLPALQHNLKDPLLKNLHRFPRSQNYSNCSTGSSLSAPCVFLNVSKAGNYNASVISGSLACSVSATVTVSSEISYIYALQASVQHEIWPGTPDPQDMMLCAFFQCVQSGLQSGGVIVCKEIWEAGQVFSSFELATSPLPNSYTVFPQVAVNNAQVIDPQSMTTACGHGCSLALHSNATKMPLFAASLYGLKF